MSPRPDPTEERPDPAGDARTDPCYRCDRPLEPDRWLRLAARPGPGVTADYDPVSRPCCPDCAAAMGLLEVVRPPATDAD